ncbi:hypothetical protein AGLY_011685 [Aphis glycines]|uniref:FLYWCH-type domain-containing protein n=1 Tax=Aphis glycines TaxID=307491 RepID=A0A6G0TAX5_APHGL|nr:hypothetical protein AGLY_011685 [Aphis glycines]
MIKLKKTKYDVSVHNSHSKDSNYLSINFQQSKSQTVLSNMKKEYSNINLNLVVLISRVYVKTAKKNCKSQNRENKIAKIKIAKYFNSENTNSEKFDKKYKNTMYWRCNEDLCKSRINLRNEEIVKGPSDHNHVISNLEIEQRVFINKMKIRALSSQDNPHQIVSEASTLCSQAVHGALPPLSYIKRTLCRIRQINSSAPSNPLTLTDITILNNFSQTIDGRQFLINDIEPVENRILVFATEKNLDLLAKSDHWFADGTFKSCPPLFAQVYTIHVIKNNLVIPVVFSLIPDKTQTFVPENDVINVFETLCESAYYTDNEEVLEPLISYFEDTWIGRPNRRKRRNPRFPISLWNCYTSTISGLPRTNNYVEGWHRGFNNLLSSCHPTIWKFIEAIQKEQSLNEMKINQYIAGVVESSRKRKRDTIKQLVDDYENRNKLEYLRVL